MRTKISSKEGNAVLLSEEEYESLLETAEFQAIPGLKESLKKADEDIKKGKVYSIEEVFEQMANYEIKITKTALKDINLLSKTKGEIEEYSNRDNLR